jgi:hypothetical protein
VIRTLGLWLALLLAAAAPSLAAAEDEQLLPVMSFSSADPAVTDLGGTWGLLSGPEDAMPQDPARRPEITRRLVWEQGDPFLEIAWRRLDGDDYFGGLWLSVFGGIGEDAVFLPREVAADVTGVRLCARAVGRPVRLKLEAKDAARRIIAMEFFEAGDEWETFAMPLSALRLKELVFVIERRRQLADEGVLRLDDVSLVCRPGSAWRLPQSDEGILPWAHDRGLRYFLWNYREPAHGLGFVPERSNAPDLISMAGMGYALAAFVIAEDEGLLSAAEARRRVLAMLRWIESLDVESGAAGHHGLPSHFLHPDGSRTGGSEDSTIDWAICAAGVRVARQRYRDDTEVAALCAALLERPDWRQMLRPDNRFSHGFRADGSPIPYDWGSSFTEEAWLVALEAAATGKVEPSVFDGLNREEREGFWPSWHGSGFTYNWLQLWTGPWEPLAANSRKAYARDAAFCRRELGLSLMGFTACGTFSRMAPDGFLVWDTYEGNTGSDVHLSGEGTVNHRIVCPYGAALAVPFIPETAVPVLAEYVRMGAAHPMIGFADSLRVADLPEGVPGPVPNWTQYAIDTGPAWMAIEAFSPGGGRVASLYRFDADIARALEELTRRLR